MSEPRVLVERGGETGVARVVLNRPERLNAFYGTMRDEVADALEELGSDDDVRVVVVTGRGRAFCAGADVEYLWELVDGERWEEAASLVEAGRRVVTAIMEMPKPVIGSLNGPAAGGGANLALACDLRIASERAAIGQTFNRIGLHPDWGGTYLLPRLVGRARAAELVFLAEMVEADRLLEMGLVNRVVPDDRLAEETGELARRLAAKPALPLRLAKEGLRRSLDASLPEMLDYELEAQMACFDSDDAREGIRAFLEKRAPDFGSGGSGSGSVAEARSSASTPPSPDDDERS